MALQKYIEMIFYLLYLSKYKSKWKVKRNEFK